MKYRWTSATALALFLAASGMAPLGAQEAQQPAPQAQPSPAPADGTATPAPAPAAPVKGQIMAQEASTLLGSELIGADVYSPTEESIGDVSDLIVTPEGAVKGVVIGVGGFLGLGAKNVAVELSELKVTRLEDGSLKLVLNSTRESLEAAPEFKTMAEIRAEEQRKLQEQQSPAPTAPPAPAN